MERMSPEQLATLRASLKLAEASSPRFVRIPPNPSGRDFVIGDVHGAFDLVWQAMRAAGFNRAIDRLFGVGDLVDRGAGSGRAGAFLAQPYVYSAMGNHEADLCELYRDQDDPEEILELLALRNFNGMGWLAHTAPAARMALIQDLATLPLALEVPTRRGTVGLVHGEVPIGMDWATFVAKLQDGDEKTIDSCLRGRKRINGDHQGGVPGIGRIFAGHTPMFGGAARYGNVYAMDTGAVFAELSGREGAAITIADMAFTTGSLVRPDQQGYAQTFTEAVDEPYGNYAPGA
jgi:serine/threonine protein phosphatase 1